MDSIKESLEQLFVHKRETSVKNRSNRLQKFVCKKIIDGAVKAIKSSKDKTLNKQEFLEFLYNNLKDKKTVKIDTLQNLTESYLMRTGREKAMRSYHDYRINHERIRDFVSEKEAFIENYKKSSNTANATVDDNSNVASKNIGVMNAEIHKKDNIQINRGMEMRKLSELFPELDSKQYVRDLEHRIFYKHDESSFAGATAPYCESGSMYPFLEHGLKTLGGLSAKPKNLDSFCGMFVNFIFATSAQFAGAVATSEFFVCFDYFARKAFGDQYRYEADEFYIIGQKLRKLMNKTGIWFKNIDELTKYEFNNEEYDKLRLEILSDSTRQLTQEELDEYMLNVSTNPAYTITIGDGSRTIKAQISQYFQQIVYSINQPAAARGMQAAFVNFSYFDKAFFEGMFSNFYFPDCTKAEWESVNYLQRYFMQWFNEERLHCLLTFPVESFALVYRDHNFVDEDSVNFVAQEYANGHSFFTYISDTADSLASCCRLKNKVQTHEFNFTNGNMGVMTGSKSVMTLNLNRISQDWVKELLKDNTSHVDKYTFSENKESFKSYLVTILERIYKYQTAYNACLYDMFDAGLLPVYSAGIITLDKQYLTIGLNGLNESAEFFGLDCTDNEDYKKFCQFIFSTIKEQNELHKTEKTTFNTECVPAESLAVKNYNWDKEDGYWVPEDRNLYASYIFKPSDERNDVFDKLILHGKDYIGEYLDGGSAAHINLTEHLSFEQYKNILKFAAEQGCQYFTFNVPNSECQDCGFITKNPIHKCPKCGSENIALYDRIIGYLTKINNWSKDRQIEQKERVYQESKTVFKNH